MHKQHFSLTTEAMTVEESTPDKTAPEPLRLVQGFVNSLHMDEDLREEELTSPEALRDWLSQRGLMESGEPVSEGDLRRAIDVREGLRALLLSNNGAALDEPAVERLDRAASRAGVRVRFRPGGDPELAPDAGGVDGAIARLLSIVAGATGDGSWARLKACSKDDCLWAFYDRTKNRSGKWCSMDTCGNVEKARAYRERHRHGSRA